MKHLMAVAKAFHLILMVFLAGSAEAQNNCGCNEGEQLRAPVSMHFNTGRLDSAAYYIHKFLTFKEKGCEINYNGGMAQVALAKKEYTAARAYLSTEEKLLKENGCDKGMYVRHFSTLAKLYQELNMFDSLTIACLNGIDAAEKAGDNYGLSRAHTDLASAFSQMDQHEKAVFYYRNAMEAAVKQDKVPSLTASVKNRLSIEYLTLFESTGKKLYADSAQLLAKQALQTAVQYQDMLAFLEANQSLADHALYTRQYDTAQKYADAILSATPRGVHLLDRLLYEGFLKKSKALLSLQKTEEAETLADSALRYASSFNAQMMVGALQQVYETAKARGNTAKSLRAYENMTVLKDSLFSLQKNNAITELEKKYNQAKNERTIKELAQQRSIYLLLAASGLLGLILLAFIIRQQSLKNKQKSLEAEQRLNRARINPHFFFNSLASLQTIALEENSGKNIANSLSKFSHIMRQSLESTYQDFATIETEAHFLREYIELQQLRHEKKFISTITVVDDIEPEDTMIPSMIVQPFVENSIEHGFAGIDYTGQVQVVFSKLNNYLKITIDDNGKGTGNSSQNDEKHISRAGQIIRDRIYLLNKDLKTNASFSIENKHNSNGVIVSIMLPLLYKNGETVSAI